MAMKRTTLVVLVEDYEASLTGFGTIVENMNESQNRAVATLSQSPVQTRFAVQGPPGCGKTTTMVAISTLVVEC
jgi:nucleoside-triphosphatase THEP1